jgi:hypothetical protein
MPIEQMVIDKKEQMPKWFNGEILTPEEFLVGLKLQKVIFLGETHGYENHQHNAQELYSLLEQIPAAVAFEDIVNQQDIDNLSSGKVSEEEFISKYHNFDYMSILKKALEISNAYAIGSDRNSNKEMASKLAGFIEKQELNIPILTIMGSTHLLTETEYSVPKLVQNYSGVKGPIITQSFSNGNNLNLNKDDQITNQLNQFFKEYYNSLIIKNKDPQYKSDYIILGKI